MGLIDIPWPSTSNPGRSPGEGSGRLINAFVYQDAGSLRWRAVPGLAVFASLPAGEIRGAYYQDPILYLVIGSAVVQVDGGGNITPLSGTLTGDGPVTIARNNNATAPAIVFVTSTGNFYITPLGVVAPYPDSNLPTQTNSVAILDGFFLWTTPGGEMIASNLNSTSINALNTAMAEARPDGLLRGVVYGQLYYAMGPETIEVWQDVGSLYFPLQRQDVIPVGLFGPWAVAGFEDGWGGPLIFVAQDGSVRRLDGYTPTRISNEDLERLIFNVTTRTDLQACVYTAGGNAFWSLSSSDWTWEFNCTTGEWHERQSYLQPNWCADLTVRAFGRAMAVQGGDNGGTLYAINPDIPAEGGNPLIWGLDSGPVKQFPIRVRLNAAYFDFVLGQASAGQDPQAMLSWSLDGGATWSNPVNRSVGQQGQYVGRVAVHRLGLSSHHGARFRFRVSDPVYSSFTGARLDAQGTR